MNNEHSLFSIFNSINMKLFYRYIGIVSLGLLLFGACSEAKKEMFQGPEAIYFRIPQGDTTLIIRRDTIVYSFAFDLEATQREICIPVEVTGFASAQERKYHVEVTPFGNTTANVHYNTVATEQTFPANKMIDSLRVVFLRHEEMQREVKKIGITIREGGDFIEGVTECLYIAIQVSDILERPEWWSAWQRYFGRFDTQVYRAWMRIWGGTGDLNPYKDLTYKSWSDAPQIMTAILELKRYFEENPASYEDDGSSIIIPGD